MLRVEDYHRIRQAHRDGMSIRGIARAFGRSRRKVRDALRDAQPKGYTRTKPPVAPKLDSFKAVIEGILEADQQEYHKQRHTAAQLYRRLRDEYGYTGGYDQVRRQHRRTRHSPRCPLPKGKLRNTERKRRPIR